jgi:hypothetical protein
MVAMHSMQSKLALRPFQLTVNDWSQSVPQVMHTAIKKGHSVRVFKCSAHRSAAYPGPLSVKPVLAKQLFVA